MPDFNNYLVYILTKLTNEQEYIRTIAGLLLKNNVKSWQAMSPEVRAYIKAEMLQCLADPMESVRHTVGSIITTIVSKEESLDEWPLLLQTLVLLLDAPGNPHVVDGAFSALTKLCEDSSGKLSAWNNGAVRIRDSTSCIVIFLVTCSLLTCIRRSKSSSRSCSPSFSHLTSASATTLSVA